MAAASHLGILKLKFVTANHFRDIFCTIALNVVELGQIVAEISHFSHFQVKCKNSPDDRT